MKKVLVILLAIGMEWVFLCYQGPNQQTYTWRSHPLPPLPLPHSWTGRHEDAVDMHRRGINGKKLLYYWKDVNTRTMWASQPLKASIPSINRN